MKAVKSFWGSYGTVSVYELTDEEKKESGAPDQYFAASTIWESMLNTYGPIETIKRVISSGQRGCTVCFGSTAIDAEMNYELESAKIEDASLC